LDVFSVTSLTRYIKSLFEGDEVLGDIMVRGEISNFKRHYSGHCYFTLKDSEATLRAVMFRGRAQFLKFEPKDGMKVIAGGQISLYERDGQYQLYVEQLIPEGMGELSLAFAQLKDKLSAEGLFDEDRKRKLPLLPRAVGVVTSPTGAALRDIVTVAKRRHPGIQLVLFPVQVQGMEAAAQIARAIEVFNRRGNVDILIVGRGGGSLEELWAFNEEKVVRAITASHIPVVSAVGHQTDYTLADFAADRRAATPSQAAEIVVPDVKELRKYIVTLYTMLESYISGTLARRRARLEQALSSRVFERPERMLADRRMALDGLIQRLEGSLRQGMLTKRHRFSLATDKLAMLSPLSVLSRGYSITRSKAGMIIQKAGDTAAGEELEIMLAEGKLAVKVLETGEEQVDAEENRRE
jgi:exodeoxyribonuclease VII large subunit